MIIDSRTTLTLLEAGILGCDACPLSQTRTRAVPGEGRPDARILFVGEGPGADEDREGRPFVGRAGGLLNEAFERAGLDRREVFIANIVKCRPPENRNPSAEEMDACAHFLEKQSEAIRPRLIVALGKVSAEFLLGRKVYATRENGHLDFMEDGTCVMIVLHPAYVLRNQTEEVRESFFQAIVNATSIAYGGQ